MEEKDKAIEPRAKKVQTLSLLFVLGMAAFIFLFCLKNIGIVYPSNEPRRMLLARDMVRNGHWTIIPEGFLAILSILMGLGLPLYVTFITPVFLGYRTPHQFCNRVKEIMGDGRLLTFWYDELYIVNELDRQIENIRSERKLRERLRREGGMFVITNFKKMEKIKGEDLEIRVLASQKPFLKRRRSIVLLYIKEKDEGGGK